MLKMSTRPFAHSDPAGSALSLGTPILVFSSLRILAGPAGQVVYFSPAPVSGSTAVKEIASVS